MAKSYLQLQGDLHFDELMRWLDGEFQAILGHRAKNVSYALADVLKSAFAMFSLKAASLLDFKKQSVPEENNLSCIYRINGAIPCDNQMRGILDPLDPSHLRPLFHGGYWRLRRAGVIRTLKNQGYHFEHNYGHGQQHLATVLALLMLLAFLVDQIQQRCSQGFRRLWHGLKTKAKLRDSLRSLFRVLVFDSMAALFRHMASLYRLQLE